MNGIMLQDICKRYGDKQVLSGLSLTLPAGQVSCVMGPSGRGKTTLAHILLGLVQPDSGRIEGLPDRVSAVFQEDRLSESLTVLANLRLSAGDRSAAELGALLDSLGLEGCARRRVKELSGGMKRRVAIARALAAEYGLLVLDEPFKGLDPETRSRAAATILERAAGRTVLLISHDRAEAELLGATEVLELDGLEKRGVK